MRGRKPIIVALSTFLYLATIVLIFYLVPGNIHTAKVIDQDSIDTSIVKTVQYRESITFILGEDHNPRNPYYSEAADYYRINKKERTEYLVTTCRSLLEVRNYLETNPPFNHLPWGLINLIAHGSEWLGLNVPVIPGSKISSTENISEYIVNGKFKPLSDSIIDDSSTIFIHGCGIGKNHSLMAIVSKAFGGETGKPLVRASKLFEFYMSRRNNGRPIECQRFLTQSFFFFFPTANKPSDSIIIRKLHYIYPEESINWKEALAIEAPRFPGEIYHYSFKIPIVWVKKFNKADLVPDLRTTEKKLKWLKQQPEIIKTTSTLNLSVYQFSWMVSNISYTNSSGEKLPAIWVKGSCTILCILKPLIIKKEGNNEMTAPFIPSLQDTIYYTLE